jgi:hypothetical protein
MGGVGVCEDLRPESDEECARWCVGAGAIVQPEPMSTADEEEYCMEEEEMLRDMVRLRADAEADLLEAVGLMMSR